MTTPCKNEPFSLVFHTEQGDTKITGFTQSAEGIQKEDLEPALSVRENQDVSVLFQGPEDFRFTMDGMDVVSVRGAEKEDGQCFLTPSGQYAGLFSGSDFPLVPGYYVLTVTGAGQTWYANLEVRPRYLEKQQWQDMRDELTQEIRELSFDFMKRNLHISRSLSDTLGVGGSMLLQFYIISDAVSQVMNALEELSRTANVRIARRLERIRPGAPIKGHIHEPAQSGRSGSSAAVQYTVRKEVTWDVAENRFVKAILMDLDRCLRLFDAELEERLQKVGAEQDRQSQYRKDYQYRGREEALDRFIQYRRQARRLRSAIRLVTHAPWYEEAGDASADLPPLTVFRDPRYAVLYRLAQDLRHPEEALSVSSFYRFQWKRTDKLYELWCFLQFIKALNSQGWEIETGPAIVKDGGQYRLERLEAGTVITLSRDGDQVLLLYDAVIPDTAADTDRENSPLYTNNPRRRPDCRLDYYHKDLYCGSLIADFKYRDIGRIWTDEASSADVRLQFNGYRDMNTKYYADLDERTSWRDSRPVKEVWAVFPKEAPLRTDQDYSLRFIPLAPGRLANQKLSAMLEEYILLLKQSSGVK